MDKIKKNGNKCLALFYADEEYERIFYRLRYLIIIKSGKKVFSGRKVFQKNLYHGATIT